MDMFMAELCRFDERLKLKCDLPEGLKPDYDGLKKTLLLVRPHCLERKGDKCLKQINNLYKRYLKNGHVEALSRGDRVNSSKCFNLLFALAEDSRVQLLQPERSAASLRLALNESRLKKYLPEVQPPTIHSQEESSQSDLSKIARPPLGKRNATSKNPTSREFAVPETIQDKDTSGKCFSEKRSISCNKCKVIVEKMVSPQPSTSKGVRRVVRSCHCSNTSDSDTDSDYSRENRCISKRKKKPSKHSSKRHVAKSSSSEEDNQSISNKFNSRQRKKSSRRSRSKRILYSDSEISFCSKPKVRRSKSTNYKRRRLQRSISECSSSSFSSSQSEDISIHKNRKRVIRHRVDSANKDRHKKQLTEIIPPKSKDVKVNTTTERNNSKKDAIGPVPEFVKKLKHLEESVLKGTPDPLEKTSNKTQNKNKKSHISSTKAPSAAKASQAPNKKSQSPAKKSRTATKKLPAPTKKSSAPAKKSPAPTKNSSVSTKKSSGPTKKSSAPTKKSLASTKKSPASTKKSPASTKKSPASNKKSSTLSKTSKTCFKASATSKKSRAPPKNKPLLSDEQSADTINPSATSAEKSLLPNKRSPSSVKSPIPSKRAKVVSKKPQVVSKKLTSASTKSKMKSEPEKRDEEESKKPCSSKELFREDDNSSEVTDSDFNLGSLSSCLNSIKRKLPRGLGTATPPLRMFLPAGDDKFDDTNVDDEMDSLSEYPVKPDVKYVVKRMAKADKPAATPKSVVNFIPSTKVNTTPETLKKIMKIKKTINSSQDDSDIECSSFSDS